MAAAAASCLTLPCKPQYLSSRSTSRTAGSTLRCSLRPSNSPLAFASNLSLTALPAGNFCSLWSASVSAVEKRGAVPRRSLVVCEAVPKKYDSAEKRARQSEKRRIYNKARKSEIRTRMKKVLEALDVLREKSDAAAEEIVPIEKLIAEAYSTIDKAVKVGTLHRNTGARRKSRLARRKKAVEIHHGWYAPAPAA